MPYAGFLRRVIAFFVDVMPITLAVGAVLYYAFDIGQPLHRYFEPHKRDFAEQLELARERKLARGLSTLLYFVYSALLESSRLRGTLGKWLLGIAIVDESGRPISYRQSWKRSSTKMLSFLPLGLGCLSAIWSPRGQAWHDKKVGTLVVKRWAVVRWESEKESVAEIGPR